MLRQKSLNITNKSMQLYTQTSSLIIDINIKEEFNQYLQACAQNPLHTFPRNFPIHGEVGNKSL